MTEKIKEKVTIINCPRYGLVNVFENKNCSKCSYPLTPGAYEEIKKSEEIRFIAMQQKYEEECKTWKNDGKRNY